MARVYEVTHNDDPDFDNRAICPRCGCNLARILSYPEKIGWFTGRTGRAECDHCGTRFAIKIEEIEEET